MPQFINENSNGVMPVSKEQYQKSGTTPYFVEAHINEEHLTQKTFGIRETFNLEQGAVFQERLKTFAETRLRSQAEKLSQVVKDGLAIELTFFVPNDIAGTWSQHAVYYQSEQRLIFL